MSPEYNTNIVKQYPANFKSHAIKLRKQGYSLSEISKEMNISKSTASAWAKDVWLDDSAKDLLNKKGKFGQINLVMARTSQKMRKEKLIRNLEKQSKNLVENIEYSLEIQKLLCAILFWAEGSKDGAIKFTNSDPKMISVFLKLFRNTFDIDEKKLRAIVHIHEYHNDKEIKEYWSELTNIPAEQFYNSYLKPNTGKRKKKGYKGCVTINYHDYKIALELKHIYNAWADFICT